MSWLIAGSVTYAVVRMVTVLVIACPHAFGLAIPLVVALSTTLGAKVGILVSDRLALERRRHVDTVLFDKTGTLTEVFHVVTGAPQRPPLRQRGPQRRRAVDADTEHPLAKAIVRAAEA